MGRRIYCRSIDLIQMYNEREFSLKQGSGNYSPLAEFSPQLAFVNKVLLDRFHIHLFARCLWLVLHYNGRTELCTRDLMIQKA